MKAIVFDLDGTVVFNDSATVFCIDTIMKCKAAGYVIGIATARPLITASKFNDLFNADFIVASGGALVQANECPAFRYIIPKNDFLNVLSLIDRIDADCKVIIESETMLYCNFNECLHWPGYQNAILFDNRSLEIDSLDALKIIIPYNVATAVLLDNAGITSRYSATVYNKRSWIRITDNDVSKKNGVEKALSVFALSLSDTMYFGDDDDDLELLQSCSLGIIVENTEEYIKQKAGSVCDRVDKDGVANWLRANILL